MKNITIWFYKWLILWVIFLMIIMVSRISYAAFISLNADKQSWNILLSSEWNQFIDNQNELKSAFDNLVDTNTQLTETQVDNFVSNNWYLNSDTTLDETQVDNFVLNNWYLTWFIDTVLSEIDVDAFVANNGFYTLDAEWSDYIRIWNTQIAWWVSGVIASAWSASIVFPQSFSSVPSVVVSSNTRTGYLCASWSWWNDYRTTTWFTLKVQSWENNKCSWIAIWPWQ